MMAPDVLIYVEDTKIMRSTRLCSRWELGGRIGPGSQDIRDCFWLAVGKNELDRRVDVWT